MKGIWIAMWALLAFAASAAVNAASTGLVLNFSAGEELRLVDASSVERVPEPRPIAGPRWTIHAMDNAGRERWTRPIAAPRMFHGGATAEIAFAVAIPMVEEGDRIVITSGEGHQQWAQQVDAALLAKADASGKLISSDLKRAYASTAQLQSTKPGQAWRDQIRTESAKLAAAHGEPNYREYDGTVEPVSAEGKAESTTADATLYRVGGSVAANNIDVRVFNADSGKFVVSQRAVWWTSRYEFQVPKGNYVFEVDDNRLRIDRPYFYRKPYRTTAIRVNGDTEVPEIPQHAEIGKFSFTAHFPCSLSGIDPVLSSELAHTLRPQITAVDGTRILRTDDSRMSITKGDLSDGDQYCPARYEFGLSPGRYSITLSVPGWEALRFDDISIAEGGLHRYEHTFKLAERTLVWRVHVTDTSGETMNSFFIEAVTELNEVRHLGYRSYGDAPIIEIPYEHGWVATFKPTWLSDRDSSVPQRFVLDGRALPSTVVLDDVATTSIPDDGMLRIHGNGDRTNRFNILFLAEGYTDVNESYTDVDGDGQWDGIVWYDMNGDGQYGSGDRHSIYGDNGYRNFPELDPSSANEPFVDQNGDGVLNWNEPARFELNARDFLRSLFGSDFWDSHRDAFNAYLLFEPSNQAGFDVHTESGQLAVQRDTRYGAYLSQPRGIMGLDRQAAMTRALSVLPEIDMVVVLVNEPVVTLARGNVTVAQPGLMVWPSGGQYRRMDEMGPSHEMGHYMASLCDEYSEFQGVHPQHGQPAIWCPNVSYVSDPAKVPWADWLSDSDPEPSRNMDGSLGVFEGADYYSGGAYRPSFNSTMRDLSPLFNAPSRAALEEAIHARTGPVRHEIDSTARCSRSDPRALRQRNAECR